MPVAKGLYGALGQLVPDAYKAVFAKHRGQFNELLTGATMEAI